MHSPQSPDPHHPSTRCALCLNHRELRESHIVPNAYFRAMKKGSNGQLISMSTAPDSVAVKSQDSLSQKLLCTECEGRFSKWETPWIRKLRVTASQFTDGADDVEVAVQSYDHESLRCFLLSIIWRAAVSSRNEFSAVQFPPAVLESLRSDLLAGKAPPIALVGIRIRKLVDPTQEIGNLAGHVYTPAEFSEGGLQGYRMFFAGYVVDYLTSKVTRRVTKIRGFVRDASTFRMPAVSCFRVREFMQVGRSMYEKAKLGKTTFNSPAP